MVFFVMCRPPT